MKQKDLLFILFSTTFVVVLWIIFGIVHTSLNSTISQNTAQDISQISSTFDVKTLNQLKKRKNIQPQTEIALSPTPSPTPTIPPITPVQPLQTATAPVASQGGKSE